MGGQSQRGTIHLEDGVVLNKTAFPAEQYILRIGAPKTAARAAAGSFVHITCDDALPMRRPLSIMRANADDGWIEILYKIVGSGLAHLSQREAGDTVSVLGPIGKPFTPDPERGRALLIGGGVGIPPMVFLAEAMHGAPAAHWQPLVLMGSEVPFPFVTRRSTIAVDDVPAGADHGIAFLDELGIASRLASGEGYPGCHAGFVTDLADHWLKNLTHAERKRVTIYACGPTAMLEATARLAHKYAVPAQVSLEEFMACAVGGCAGCTVPVYTPDGVAMKRVCVDGPVFDAASVFPPNAQRV